MKKKIWIALIILTIVLAACSSSNATAPSFSKQSQEKGMEMPLSVAEEGGVPVESVASDYETAPQANNSFSDNINSDAGSERMVIKNADLEIVVKNPTAKMKQVAEMAEAMGGFVVTSNLYQRTLSNGLKVNQASVTIRVPAERLTEAIDKIKEGTGDVLHENISGQDVTKEYTDLNSRLVNLEAAEKQLTKIMDNAVKTEDVLRVYDKLVQIRENIEVIKGQMKYYKQAAALSSIDVQITADEAIQPVVIGGWKPQGTAKKAAQTLIATLQKLVDLGIWLLICVLPIALLVAIPVYLFYRIIRRRLPRRKKNSGDKKAE